MNTEKWLSKLERKFGRHSISGLMNIVLTGMVIVYIMDNIISPASGKMPLGPALEFSRYGILHGQIWRLITFIFEPADFSAFFLIFTIYFYWLMGQVMESKWGTFRFNIFFFSGMLGAIISGFITGYTSNQLLLQSMFLAFAVIAPDFQILLFFFIPIKIKYIAILETILLIVSFFLSGFSGKITIIMSLINLFIFFGDDFIQLIKMKIHHWKYKLNIRK